MKKYILHLLFSAFCAVSFSQEEYVLKKPLSKGDLLFLKQQLRDYNFFEQQLNFSYSASEFLPQGVIKQDKAFDIEEIKKIKSRLKGDCEDAAHYYDIGMAYKFNYKYEDAVYYLNKSLEKAKERVLLKPDSASAFRKLGIVYLGLENFPFAITAFETAVDLDPKDKYSDQMYKALQYNIGENLKGDSLILAEVKKYPDSLYPYASLPVYYLSRFISKYSAAIGADKKIALVKNKKIDEMEDLSLVRNAYEKNKKDARYELIYRASQLCLQMGKTFIMATGDTATPSTDVNFTLDDNDRKNLAQLSKFFESCIDNKSIYDQYTIHKSLAIIATMKMELPKAMAELEQAIKIKEQRGTTFYLNADADYDNLQAIYFLAKDTAGLEKVLQRKIKTLPAINPNPGDYVRMAQLNFYYRNYDKAKEYAEKALSICETSFGANLCLCAIQLVNNNVDGALEPLKKEQQLAPNSFSFLIIGGIYSLMVNDTDVAAACFKEAQKQAGNPATIQKDFIDKFLVPVKK